MDVGILALQLLHFLLVLLRQVTVIAILILTHKILELEGGYLERLPSYFPKVLFGQGELLLIARFLDASNGPLVDTIVQLRAGQLGDVGGEQLVLEQNEDCLEGDADVVFCRVVAVALDPAL
jgi:hypothetical protein